MENLLLDKPESPDRDLLRSIALSMGSSMEESEVVPWDAEGSQRRLVSGDLDALREGLTDILSNGPLNLDTPTPKRSPPSKTAKDRVRAVTASWLYVES